MSADGLLAQVIQARVRADDAARLAKSVAADLAALQRQLEAAAKKTATPERDPDGGGAGVSMTPAEFEAFTRKHGVRWEEL